MKSTEVRQNLDQALKPGASRKVRITFSEVVKPGCFSYLLRISNSSQVEKKNHLINLSVAERMVLAETNKTGLWPKLWLLPAKPRTILFPFIQKRGTIDIDQLCQELSEYIEKIQVLPS